jgi:hypothetical protein
VVLAAVAQMAVILTLFQPAFFMAVAVEVQVVPVEAEVLRLLAVVMAALVVVVQTLEVEAQAGIHQRAVMAKEMFLLCGVAAA